MLKRVAERSADWEGTHITFDNVPDTKTKTSIWNVNSKYDGFLGRIKWFSRWRKYSFFPETDCVFEEVCMREISEFIVERTKEHKGD